MVRLGHIAISALAALSGTAYGQVCAPVFINDGLVRFAPSQSNHTSLNAYWDCIVNYVDQGKFSLLELRLPNKTYQLARPLQIPSRWAEQGMGLNLTGGGTTITGAAPIKQVQRLHRHLYSAKLPELHKPGVMAIASRDHGELLRNGATSLLVDGRIFWRTEWPKSDYLNIVSADAENGSITVKAPADLRFTEGMQIQGFPAFDWADTTRLVHPKLTQRTDDNWVIKIQGTWPKYGVSVGGRLKIMNGPLARDDFVSSSHEPEENKFYFRSRSRNPAVTYTAIDNLLEGERASNVMISGINFTGSRRAAISLTGNNIQISGCKFFDHSTSALRLEGTDIEVKNSRFVRFGATPVWLKGGDRFTLTSSNIRFVNNLVSDFGKVVWSSVPGVRLDGVGGLIEHNLIFNGPHAGIFYFGNDHVIRNNEVHSIALRTGDVGAIYTGRDWAGRGHLISGNHIHNIHGLGKHGATAIYLDDQSSGITVRNNLINNAHRGVLVGGGKDNTVFDNHFTAVKICIRADSRGLGWQSKDTASGATLFTNLSKVPHTSRVWQERYPEMNDILDNRPGSPLRNVLRSNVSDGCEWIIDDEVRTLGEVRDNRTLARLHIKTLARPLRSIPAGVNVPTFLVRTTELN